MKKLNKILILILSIFVITSCQKQDDILKIDVDVVDNEVFTLDEFELEDLKLKVYIDEDVFRKISLEESMLSSEDLLKLSGYGKHEITVSYKGFTDVFVIELVAGSVVEPETFELTIFELNDTHGYIEQNEYGKGGLSNVAKIIDDERIKNSDDDVVLIANGDMFQGTAISNVTEGLSVIEAMNEMDFDMMGIGNHEFDWGIDKILRYFDNDASNGEANFPLLNANIYERSTNRLLLNEPGKMFESIIVEKEDIKVGLVSFIGDVAGSITLGNIRPYEIKLDFEERATRICSSLKDRGADVIIVNIHGGDSSGVHKYDFNNIVSNIKYNGEYLVDAIVNGHTHTRQKGYIERTGDVSVPVVQSSGNNQGIGKITLDIDLESKDVVSSNIINLNVDDTAYNGHVQEVVDRYASIISQEVYCKAGETVYSREDLGFWVAEVLRHATGASIAVINTGGVRSNGDIVKGNNVTINNVYSFYPFDNQICLTKVKAKDIYNLLNRYEFYYSCEKDLESYANSNEEILVSTVDYLYYKSYFPGNETGIVTNYVITDMIIKELRLQDVFFPISNPNVLIGEYIKYEE